MMTGWIVDDAARLRTLSELGLVGAPAEAEFDAIAADAAALCHAPVALITLLERDRQWFMASTGTALSETPIGDAICVHVLQHGSLLVIPDLTADPRTAANRLVTGEPHLRFYAGVPLVTAGQALGTLCVLDVAPRPNGLSDEEQRSLETLAADAVALIEASRQASSR